MQTWKNRSKSWRTGSVREPVSKRNRGWFREGDWRINREGRPLGSKAASPEESPPADRAPCTDRL